MKLLKSFFTFLSLGTILLAPEAMAVIDSDAAVVKVRKTCQEGPITLDNCFTSIPDLQNWIVTRNPSDASPLFVEIGPGSFGSFSCNHAGISLRGAGPDKTRLGNNSFYAIYANAGCDNFYVEALNADPFTGYGIGWGSSGSSTWTNVRVKGTWGWLDSRGINQEECGVHRWRASLIIGTLKAAYQDSCGEHWFLGTEIAAEVSGITRNISGLLAFGGEYHVYGSNIRVIGTANCGRRCAGSGLVLAAVSVGGGSDVHIHGTGIDAIGKGPYDVAGILAYDGAQVHASATAYNLQVAAGQTRYRLIDDGALHLHAPYLWEQHAEPPADVASVSGADMAVVTNTVDGQPHLLIYSDNCTSKWFDTVEKACRP